MEHPRGNEKLTLVLDEVISDVGFNLKLIDKFPTCGKDDPFIFHYQRLDIHCDLGLVACLAQSTATQATIRIQVHVACDCIICSGITYSIPVLCQQF